MIRLPPRSTRTGTLFPYPTLFRSVGPANRARACCAAAAESGNINETLTPAADTPAARTAVPAAWRARNGRRRHPYGHKSEEHTSELQSLMRLSYAVFCLKNKKH